MFKQLHIILFIVLKQLVVTQPNVLSNLLDNKTCVYLLISNDFEISSANEMEYLLKSLPFPLFILSMETYTKNDRLGNIYGCLESGYILLGSSQIKWRKLRPHNRVIAIYQECDQNCMTHLMEATYQSLNVFLLSGHQDNQENKDNQLLPKVFSLVEVMSISENRTLDINQLDNSIPTMLNLPLKFKEPMKIITAEYWSPFPNGVQPNFTPGLENDIFRMIAATLHWPMNISIRPPFTWTEMVTEVRLLQADFSICGHYETRLQLDNVDFISYMLVETTFLVPRPTRLPLQTFMFQSFDNTVWLALILTLGVTSQVINRIYKWHERLLCNKYFMITLSYFAMNGTTRPGHSRLLNFVFVFLGFTCLLLSTSYSAGFSAISNMPPTKRPVKTFNDAIEDKLKCYVIDDYLMGVLRTSGDPIKIQFSKSMIIDKRANDVADVCVSLDIMQYRFFQSFGGNYMRLKNLMVLKENAQSSNYAFVVAKKSPYFQGFNIGVTRFLEHGLIKYLVKNRVYGFVYSFEQLERHRDTSNRFIPGYLLEMQGAFYLLLLGYTLSLICFGLEKSNFHYVKSFLFGDDLRIEFLK